MKRPSLQRHERALTGHDLPGLGALQVVEALSRHATMREAGEELGVTHAAVSTTISRLETRLGVKLFERGGGPPRPTAACRGLLEAYGAATAALTRAVRAAAEDALPKVTVSLPRGAAQIWLSARLHLLHADAPSLAFRTHGDAEAPDFTAVDAAVVAAGLTPPPGCDGVSLFEERLTAVCTQPYAYAQRIGTPVAIARSTLLVHSRDDWRRWFEEAGLVAGVEVGGVEVGDRALALQLALAGQGVGLACAAVVRDLVESGRLVLPVPVSLATGRRYWLAWPRGHRPSDDLLRLQDWLERQLPRAAKGGLAGCSADPPRLAVFEPN